MPALTAPGAPHPVAGVCRSPGDGGAVRPDRFAPGRSPGPAARLLTV